MFDMTKILSVGLAGELMERRYLKPNRAKYRYNDPVNNVDAVVVIHFNESFAASELYDELYDELHFGELVAMADKSANCYLQCKLVQL